MKIREERVRNEPSACGQSDGRCSDCAQSAESAVSLA
jgi:hypothetical protein